MRVLQINNHEAVIGGSDRVYQATCELLAGAGHEVVSLACGDAAPPRPHRTSYVLPYNSYRGRSPVEAVRNGLQFLYRPGAARLVREIVERHRPDVAHLHIFYGHLTSSILDALAGARVPIVMSVHEYRMLCPVSTMFRGEHVCEACAGGRYWHAVRNRCNRGRLLDSVLSAGECYYRDARHAYEDRVDHFIMVSEFCRRTHVTHRPAVEPKSSTLYNFVDLPAGPGPAPESPGYLLYAGRLSAEKGVEGLLAAAAELPEVEVRIAGTGAREADLRARFAKLPNVRFLGHLSGAELTRVVAGARFCVVPSIWYENNPMSVLESFAKGVPVIGSRIGGIPELITDGVNGFLFDPADPEALRRCIERAWRLPPAEHERMRQACTEDVRRRHSPEVHLGGLLAIYERAAEHARQRHA